MSQTNNLNLPELLHQIQTLNQQNSLLKAKLESLLEGGGIKILFPNKSQAKQIIYRVKPRLLKPLPEYSINPLNSPNLILEGDNLQALVSLHKYREKIDLILTDPPYNTGKDFRYNDNWIKDPNDPGLGDYVKADDPSRHTKWMKFMLPRLIVMRAMLKDTGVLAICIDERELFNLGKMLDEVFGEENRAAIINWQKAYAPKSQVKHISSATEYVIVYAKNKENLTTNRLKRTAKQDKRYSNPDNDPRGFWSGDNASVATTSKSAIYAIQNPFTGGLFYPPRARGWGIKKSEIRSLLEEWGSEYEERNLGDGYSKALVLKGVNDPQKALNDPIVQKASKQARVIYKKGQWPKLIFLREGKGQLRLKRYLNEIKGVVATTYWASENFSLPELGSVSLSFKEAGHSQAGVRELNATVGASDDKFIGVKPLKLFLKIIQLWCPPNGLVLDPFAGTGTTGEAVLQLNQTQKTNRSFILIEQGNPKNGDNFTKTLLYPRLKAAITGQWADNKPHEPLPGSFKYLKLTKQINSQTLLEMQREDLTEAILSTHLNFTPLPNNTYLIAKNSQNEGIYLIWNGNPRRESKLSEKTYRQCLLERKVHQLSPTCHIYARTAVYSPSSVIFHKIPDNLLSDFGISPEFALKKPRKSWAE